jgi:(p)ppGpp synthase/HD superfamily hydrolase
VAIHELEIIQALARATGQLKNKEHSRKSLYKGKSLTAIEALDTLLKKRREEANKEFKKVTTAVRIDINQKKNALRRKGV